MKGFVVKYTYRIDNAACVAADWRPLMKKCGILLPVFSLPSKYGIGTFGKNAYSFVDFLDRTGQSLWQILPLTQTSFGDSPYQSPSAFAGNPYFIDPDILFEKGYINKSDLDALTPTGERIDYGRLYSEIYPMLRQAFVGFLKNIPDDYAAFLADNEYWLDNYALFMAIKDDMGGGDFHLWQDEYLLRQNPDSLKEKYKAAMDFYRFIQYEFYTQYMALKRYANERDISIIGDLPIYVSCDSADLWSEPEQFLLDGRLVPTRVAGVPPDDFSATGQLWGNPLYNWEKMRADGYLWWIERIRHAAKLYDKIRIDHFIGFCNYFSIPKDAITPAEGVVMKGPGYDIFEKIMAAVPEADIIAEDLGMLREGVDELLMKTGFPGMKVMQFSFEGGDGNPHTLINHTPQSVVYTGTHDNPTTRGFWDSLTTSQKLRYARRMPAGYKNSVDRMIAYAMSSVADTVIIPMQDYLGLGNEARINAPSTTVANWSFVMSENYNRTTLIKRIKRFAYESGREK